MNTEEIRARLDKALASPDGVSIAFRTKREAVRFRMAAYSLRRSMARKTPGPTPYDALAIRIVPPLTVLIEHVRPLPEAEPLPPDYIEPPVIREPRNAS